MDLELDMATNKETMTVSCQWAAFIHAASHESLPRAALEQAKHRVLDCLATAVAARGLAVPGLALGFVRASGGALPGSGKSTVYTHDLRVSAVDAAFVNATLVNGGSRDDFLEKSHPGALTMPAAIAIAEQEGSSGAEVLAAMVLGYEIVGRTYLGGPGMLPRFRASGVAGTIGAAATAGKLLGLDMEQLAHALGCASVFSSGFGAGFLAGTTDVKLNLGMSCRGGVTAALLARCGATASPLAFEGKAGFYEAFAGTTAQVHAATDGLGSRFLIDDTVYKERPVCIFTQTPIHLAKALVARTGLDPARIRRVAVTVPEATFTNPGFQNPGPYGSHLQAIVSARFCTAAALLGRPVESYDFYNHRDDGEVLALATRTDLAVGPAQDGDRVRIDAVLDDGTAHGISGAECETLRPTAEKTEAKFRLLCAGLGPARIEQIIDTVSHLEELQDLGELTRLLVADER
jgi:2-methylcitrate dehydratase PrpD